MTSKIIASGQRSTAGLSTNGPIRIIATPSCYDA